MPTNKLINAKEFLDFCCNVISEIAGGKPSTVAVGDVVGEIADRKPSDLVAELEHKDLQALEEHLVTDVLTEDIYGAGYSVDYILDDVAAEVRDFLDAHLGMDIVGYNLYTQGYEVIDFDEDISPLEAVRRSLVIEVESYIVAKIRDKVESATGLDPYNESWELV